LYEDICTFLLFLIFLLLYKNFFTLGLWDRKYSEDQQASTGGREEEKPEEEEEEEEDEEEEEQKEQKKQKKQEDQEKQEHKYGEQDKFGL
jgi:flagellar biosynthesis/type III secretory pathway M-ring protein FliF/YscJ